MGSIISGQASKFLVAVLGAVTETLAMGHFDWRTLVISAATAIAVYLVPNSSLKTP